MRIICNKSLGLHNLYSAPHEFEAKRLYYEGLKGIKKDFNSLTSNYQEKEIRNLRLGITKGDMNKKEEIREGIGQILSKYHNQVLFAEEVSDIIKYLSSQGVVIKVENELPDRFYFNEDNKDMELELSGHTQTEMLRVGYVKVESLEGYGQ